MIDVLEIYVYLLAFLVCALCAACTYLYLQVRLIHKMIVVLTGLIEMVLEAKSFLAIKIDKTDIN